MSYLSTNAKEAIIQKVLSKDDSRTIKEIAKANNIGYSTLSRWIRCYQDSTIATNKTTNGKWPEVSLSSRFQHLIATASLDETTLGIYCREQGLFSFQLKQWKEEFMTQNTNKKQQACQSELKSLRIENKQLKQEIRRKDSALAETAALLVLKKKASLIWGGTEDD